MSAPRSLIPPLLAALFWVITPGSAHGDARHLDFRGARYAVYTVDLRRSALRLFPRESSGRFRNAGGIKRWAEAHGERLLFATNAGIFGRDLQPLGLLIAEGPTVSPLNKDGGAGNFFLKPNGVFLAGSSGAAIVETGAYRARGGIALAAQSGPLLAINGAVHPAFTPGSANRVVRSGVGVRSPQEVVFAISEEPVNFHDFAGLFIERLGCPDALYLDGYISSMYAPAIGLAETGGDYAAMFAVLEPAR